MARILIAGCGYVGSALAARLVDDGHRVWGLRRDAGLIPEGIEPIAADLSDAASLKGLPAEIDTVCYTAGASTFSESAYHEAYVLGVGNFLDALRASGASPKRILFTSSTGVYAQTDGGWVDETSATEPEGFSGKTVLQGERLFEESGIESVSLRLGGIYGPGRTGLLDSVRAGTATRSREDRYINLIHRDDIVGAMVHLIALERPDAVYVGVDDEPQERNALIGWMAEELGLPQPPLADGETSGRPFRNRRCRNARLRASGYVFQHPSCRKAYRELM